MILKAEGDKAPPMTRSSNWENFVHTARPATMTLPVFLKTLVGTMVRPGFQPASFYPQTSALSTELTGDAWPVDLTQSEMEIYFQWMTIRFVIFTALDRRIVSILGYSKMQDMIYGVAPNRRSYVRCNVTKCMTVVKTCWLAERESQTTVLATEIAFIPVTGHDLTDAPISVYNLNDAEGNTWSGRIILETLRVRSFGMIRKSGSAGSGIRDHSDHQFHQMNRR